MTYNHFIAMIKLIGFYSYGYGVYNLFEHQYYEITVFEKMKSFRIDDFSSDPVKSRFCRFDNSLCIQHVVKFIDEEYDQKPFDSPISNDEF